MTIPFQRLTVADVPDWEEAVRLARAIPGPVEASRLGALLLADPAHFPEALALLEGAIGALHGVGRAVALIRLGTALQYSEQHAAALVRFAEAERLLVELGGAAEQHLDFVYQHRGKCLVELGRLDDARVELERARSRRVAKGDAALLASTDRALAALEARK